MALNEARRLARQGRRELPTTELRTPDGVVSLADLMPVPRTTELQLEGSRCCALASLRPLQRDTLALRVVGHSYPEIQPIRGITYTNVNRHVREGTAAARRLRDAA